MDSSNAERAWERYRDSEIISNWDEAGGAFIAGYESRDAEVEALREQLAAAEAVIEAALTFDGQQTVDGVTDRGYLSPDEWRDEQITQILAAAPSSVLAAAKAEAWDEGAAANWDGQDLRYPNPYRTGDTNA